MVRRGFLYVIWKVQSNSNAFWKFLPKQLFTKLPLYITDFEAQAGRERHNESEESISVDLLRDCPAFAEVLSQGRRLDGFIRGRTSEGLNHTNNVIPPLEWWIGSSYASTGSDHKMNQLTTVITNTAELRGRGPDHGISKWFVVTRCVVVITGDANIGQLPRHLKESSLTRRLCWLVWQEARCFVETCSCTIYSTMLSE